MIRVPQDMSQGRGGTIGKLEGGLKRAAAGWAKT